MKNKYQLIVIGAGAAGMASAISAYENGIHDILLVEKDSEYGGILQQCIHNGFGLHIFKEELSGPSYAEKYYDLLKDKQGIEIIYNSFVDKIEKGLVKIINQDGINDIECEAIIIATGSRERPAGAIGLKGDRCAGIYTAGSAQKYINQNGVLVGKKVFILGSGDIGLIMARRMTLEGAKVIGVAEIQPYSNGLPRNIKQCLDDFSIPLYLSHTVEAVHGDANVESITLIEVDENLNKIKGSEKEIECDCLLLSVGLLPDDILLQQLNIELDKKTKGPVVDDNYMVSDGIFACGNALHIHDLVDYVSLESTKAGKAASEYIKQSINSTDTITNNPSNGISYIVPQSFHLNKDVEFMFRVNKVYKDCFIHVYGNGIDKKIKKIALIPSKMESVMIKKEELADLSGELNWEIIE